MAFAKDGLLGEDGNLVRDGIDLVSKASTLGSATRNAADHTAWPLIDLAWHVYNPLSESESSEKIKHTLITENMAIKLMPMRSLIISD